MNPEQQDFEALRRLLTLKRYEQPPPRYFNDFSSKVIARIQAGETSRLGESGLERFLAGAPWLLRFWQVLDARPVFAGAFGMVVCGLMVSGVFLAENGPMAPATSLVSTLTPEDSQATAAVATEQASVDPLLGAGMVLAGGMAVASPSTSDSLFDEVRHAQDRPQAWLASWPAR